MSQKHRSPMKPQVKSSPRARIQERPTDPLKAERIEGLLATAPGWQHDPKERAITRTFEFPGVPSATAFANMATYLGVEQRHPARVHQVGNTVTCLLSSARVGDVTLMDFELARQISLQA